MTVWRLLILTLALLSPAALAATLPPDLGLRLHRGYVQPTLERLEQASAGLATALSTYCETPHAAQRRQVDERFVALTGAWGRAELLRFGPLLEKQRLERFFFFPDPRGVTQRQVSALLAAADPELLQAAQLRQRSVAVQGLPALELALYASGATREIAAGSEVGRYRCGYARAIAANLLELSGELRQAWRAQGTFARQLIQPGAKQPLYRSTGEVGTELLKTLTTGLQAMREIKLLPALGPSAEQARGQRAPLWRSGQTQTLLRANAEGLRDLYRAAALGEQLGADQQWIDTTFNGDLQRLVDLLSEPIPRFDQAVQSADGREQLTYAVLLLKNLQAVAVEYLPAAFGVNLGFNSLDGD